MGGTFSKRKREHAARHNFVVTLVVASKRLRTTARFQDGKEDKKLSRMSWLKYGSQGSSLGWDVLLEQAAKHLQSGALRSAEYSLLHIVARDPENIEARILLAKVFLSQRLPYKAEKLYEEILIKDPEHREGLTDYGVYLGKYAKEYELSEQVLRLAVLRNPKSRRTHVLHLHAQELANCDGPRGVELEKAVEPPPVVPFGTGPTMYGEMCEPPHEAPVAWEDRHFQDAESLIRQAYMERYADVLDDEIHGNLDEPENTMIPKVARRGKANKLFCNFVDEPSLLEAPTDVRRGNLVWPDEWYVNGTVMKSPELSNADKVKLVQKFKIAGIEHEREDKEHQAFLELHLNKEKKKQSKSAKGRPPSAVSLSNFSMSSV